MPHLVVRAGSENVFRLHTVLHHRLQPVSLLHYFIYFGKASAELSLRPTRKSIRPSSTATYMAAPELGSPNINHNRLKVFLPECQRRGWLTKPGQQNRDLPRKQLDGWQAGWLFGLKSPGRGVADINR